MRSGTKPGWIFNNNGLFSEHKPRRKTTPWESHKNNYIVGIFIHTHRFKKETEKSGVATRYARVKLNPSFPLPMRQSKLTPITSKTPCFKLPLAFCKQHHENELIHSVWLCPPLCPSRPLYATKKRRSSKRATHPLYPWGVYVLSPRANQVFMPNFRKFNSRFI